MNDRIAGLIKRPFVIVGAGQVGSAIARALNRKNLNVAVVISRSHSNAASLATDVGADIAATHVASIPAAPCNIICAVPDNAIDELARSMAGVRRDWLHTIVVHTSGAHSSRLLDPVREIGALTGSFHPLMTVADGSEEDIFSGCLFGVEGDKLVVGVAERLAEIMGASTITIDADSKGAYHLGASIVSNFMVALFGMANDVLATAGLSHLEAGDLYGQLARQTVDNVTSMSHANALTGPIARGDTETIDVHLRFMRERIPQLLPVYSSLATETVRLAVKAGKIDSERARKVLDLIHKALLPSLDEES